MQMQINSPAEKRAFWRMIVVLSLPIMGRNLIDVLVTSVDVMVLGSVNQNAMAAVGLAGNVQFMLSLFMFGLSAGSSLLSSQYWGRGDVRAIERIFGIAMRFSLLVSLVFSVAALTMPQTLMSVFTPDPVLIVEGVKYLRIVAFTYVLTGFTELYIIINRSIERVVLAPVVYSISFAVSLALNLYFVLVLEWGVLGVAYSTLAARVVEFLICTLHAARNQRFRVRISDIFRRHEPLLADFLRYSLPVIGNDMAWGVGFTMYSVIIGHLSSDAIAAYSIVAVARKLGTLMCFGLSNVTAIVVGKALGANRMEEALAYSKRLIYASMALAVLGGLMILGLMPVFLNMAELTQTAAEYLRRMLMINSYYVLGMAFNTVMICGIFRPGGDTRFGFYCDTLTLWAVMIPIGALCAFVLKLPVMWVYFILYLDEFVKIPFVIRHYTKRGWLRNITRDLA